MAKTSEEKQLHAYCQRSLPNKFKNIRFEGDKQNQPVFFLNDKKSNDLRLAIVDITIYDDEWDPKIVIEIEPDANPKAFFWNFICINHLFNGFVTRQTPRIVLCPIKCETTLQSTATFGCVPVYCKYRED